MKLYMTAIRKVRERDYKDPAERKAFLEGYAFAKQGLELAEIYSERKLWFPNAYAAGYWEGGGNGS